MVSEAPAFKYDNHPTTPNTLDKIEARIVELGGEVRKKGEDGSLAPLVHLFTPGLYTRQIFMKAGLIITSKVHKTEHPFIVSHGRCLVMIDGDKWVDIKAPHTGVTKPGTRRLLLILEDTIWTTFHVTNLTDVADIEDEILVDYQNPLLDNDGNVLRLMEGEKS